MSSLYFVVSGNALVQVSKLGAIVPFRTVLFSVRPALHVL